MPDAEGGGAIAVPKIDHPMSEDELDATIKSLDEQTEKMHADIINRYGSMHDAVMHKQNGDAFASNLLRERGRLMKERLGWQRSLAAIKRKGPF